MERTYPPAPAVHTFSTKQLGGARYLLPQRGWEWMERGEGRGILQDSLKKHFFRFRTGLIILSSDAPGRGSWYNRPCPAIHTHVHTCMPCTCTDMHTRTHRCTHTCTHVVCARTLYEWEGASCFHRPQEPWEAGAFCLSWKLLELANSPLLEQPQNSQPVCWEEKGEGLVSYPVMGGREG